MAGPRTTSRLALRAIAAMVLAALRLPSMSPAMPAVQSSGTVGPNDPGEKSPRPAVRRTDSCSWREAPRLAGCVDSG